MTPDKLIEVVSRMTPGEWSFHEVLGSVYSQKVLIADMALPNENHGAAPADHIAPNARGIVVLRNHAVPIIEALQSDLAAAQARVKELEVVLQSVQLLSTDDAARKAARRALTGDER